MKNVETSSLRDQLFSDFSLRVDLPLFIDKLLDVFLGG
jgi:hypothetical protein